MTGSYFLRPWPHEDWAATAAAGVGRTWLWMDLTGTVIRAGLPDRPMLTSWLWGWSDGEWIRLRLDGDRVLGAQLREADPGQPGWRSVLGHSSTALRIAPGGTGRRAESGGSVGVIEIDVPALLFMRVLP